MAIGKLIGALRVALSLDTAQFARGTATASASLDVLHKRIGSTVTRLAALAAALAGPAAIAALTKNSLAAIDAQSKLGRQLGGTTLAIQALTRAGDLAGVSQETLAAATGRLNAMLGQVERTGAGPAKEALDALGLSARALTRLDADERLAVIADAMREGGYTAAQMADALRQLGIRQAEVIHLVADGGDAIRAAREEVQRYGVAVSDIEGRQIEQANDAWSAIGFTLSGIGNRIAVAVAPIVEGLAGEFSDAAEEAGGFGTVVEDVMDRIFNVVGWIADRLYQIRFLFKTLELGINVVMLGLARIGDFFGDNSEGVDYYRQRISALTDELDYLQEQGLPSERLNEWVEAVRSASEQTAAFAENWERMQSRRQDAGLTPVAIPEDIQSRLDALRQSLLTTEQEQAASHQRQLEELDEFLAAGAITEAEYRSLRAAADAQYREAVAGRETTYTESKLEALRSSLMTEAEQEQASYEARLADLDAFHSRRMLEEEEFHRLTEAAERQHQEYLDRIREDAERKRIADRQAVVSQWASVLGDLSRLIGEEGEKQFKIAKGLAIAEALMNTAQAVTKTLASYPWPLSGIMAAGVAAAGAVQIAAIRRQQPSGSGAVTPVGSGGGAGAGAASGAPVGGAQPGQTLTIRGLNRGDLFTGDSVRELAEKLVEFQRNGGQVVYA